MAWRQNTIRVCRCGHGGMQLTLVASQLIDQDQRDASPGPRSPSILPTGKLENLMANMMSSSTARHSHHLVCVWSRCRMWEMPWISGKDEVLDDEAVQRSPGSDCSGSHRRRSETETMQRSSWQSDARSGPVRGIPTGANLLAEAAFGKTCSWDKLSQTGPSSSSSAHSNTT
uniref:Uncharacterized protein n=1 Tax=Oryza rufipogon TaxID=4529 RepID=A0A0E0PW74_ORYRU